MRSFMVTINNWCKETGPEKIRTVKLYFNNHQFHWRVDVYEPVGTPVPEMVVLQELYAYPVYVLKS